MDIGDGEFPNVPDGDVKLVLGASRIHQVDSDILRRATEIGRAETEEDSLDGEPPAFVTLLAPDRAAQLSKKAIKKGVSTRYHIVATGLRTDERGSYVLTLEAVDLDEDGTLQSRLKPYLGLETGQRIPAVFETFTAILGSLYNRPIDLGGPNEPLHDRFLLAVHMVDLAENLGGKYHIVPELVNALKQPCEGPTLYHAMAEDPAYWLEFSSRNRSRELFREAMIYGAGRLQTLKMRESSPDMTAEIYQIVENKFQDIKKRVILLFQNILSYYPVELHRTAVSGYADTDNIGRNSYSNDIFSWMALTLYRQYISHEVIKALDDEDMGYDLVSKMRKGGEAYLSKEEIEPFYTVFPMTAKAKKVVERKLKEIKDHVKTWPDSLLKNNAEIDINTQLKVYFTCVELNEGDYPFEEVKRRHGPFEEDESDD